MSRRTIHRILVVCCATVTATLSVDGALSAALAQQHEERGGRHDLAGDSIPLQTEHFPRRPGLLVEIGEQFLKFGPLSRGIRLPTGAVWRPALWVFGTYRSSVRSFDNSVSENGEWAHRLDIFANLRLTGTERVLIGFRPADEFGGVGYNFGAGVDQGSGRRRRGYLQSSPVERNDVLFSRCHCPKLGVVSTGRCPCRDRSDRHDLWDDRGYRNRWRRSLLHEQQP